MLLIELKATSRPYQNTTGKKLVLNAATVRGGVLKAGLQYAGNNSFIHGFGLPDCVPFSGDDVAVSLGWAGGTVAPAGTVLSLGHKS
jgi:hypothetical protein